MSPGSVQMDVQEQAVQREIEGIVGSMKRLRSELESKLSEYQTQVTLLGRVVRRTSSESSRHYRAYATAHDRLSRALLNSIHRTASMDSLLENARAEQQDLARQQDREDQKARLLKAKQQVFDLQLPREDDFESLYGTDEENP